MLLDRCKLRQREDIDELRCRRSGSVPNATEISGSR